MASTLGRAPRPAFVAGVHVPRTPGRVEWVATPAIPDLLAIVLRNPAYSLGIEFCLLDRLRTCENPLPMSEQNPLAGSNVDRLAGCLHTLLWMWFSWFFILPAVLLAGSLLICLLTGFFSPVPPQEAKRDQPVQMPLVQPARPQPALVQPPAIAPVPDPQRQLTPDELAKHRAHMAKIREQIAKEEKEKAKEDAENERLQREKAATAALKLIKQNLAEGKGNSKDRLQKFVKRFGGTEASKEAEKLLKDME
jgi:hypothetical protein